MSDLKEIAKEYNFKIKAIEYLGNVVILDTDQGKYVYKNNNNYEIYDYLLSRDFSFFPKPINSKNTNYEIVNYINNKKVSKEQKLNDLIHISSFLHKKTSFQKELDAEQLKKMYEDMQNEVNYLMNYYNDLNNYIDNITFMSPTEYLLVSNINLFYYLLSFVKVESENWYKEVNKTKGIRYSMIHNNLELSHLMEGNNISLISWNKAHIDIPIKDLVKLYQNNYDLLDLEDFIKEYEKENHLDYKEKLFLLLNLSIPKRIEFTNNTYLDSYKLSKYLVYLQKIVLTVQKFEKSKQKN